MKCIHYQTLLCNTSWCLKGIPIKPNVRWCLKYESIMMAARRGNPRQTMCRNWMRPCKKLMRAQVRDHFDSLASPPTGARSPVHNIPGKRCHCHKLVRLCGNLLLPKYKMWLLEGPVEGPACSNFSRKHEDSHCSDLQGQRSSKKQGAPYCKLRW